MSEGISELIGQVFGDVLVDVIDGAPDGCLGLGGLQAFGGAGTQFAATGRRAPGEGNGLLVG
ncbi:MAG: hypothetical protein M1608_17390 [Candidatus Omnitrophica bacterium]|nr:hypothetical protein [Candidatus Omnitrophota bacterium]